MKRDPESDSTRVLKWRTAGVNEGIRVRLQPSQPFHSLTQLATGNSAGERLAYHMFNYELPGGKDRRVSEFVVITCYSGRGIVRFVTST